MLRPLFIAALLALVACNDAPSDDADDADAPADAAPDVSLPDVSPPEADAAARDAVPPDAAPVARCAADPDCPEGTWCDEAGQCRPGATALFVDPPNDGVTRAAAASFDIAPAYLERWTERAGPECPGNVRGRFDGRVDVPSPADPCADGFEDADGDGHFDGVWMGGGELDRPAMGVDNTNPPAGRVLVFVRDDLPYVLVTLDVHAIDLPRARDLARHLRLRLALPEARVAVHATGNRNGPDAVGVFGPSLLAAGGPAAEGLRQRGRRALGLLASVPIASGVAEPWWAETRRRCEAAIRQAGHRLAPVTVRAGTVELPLEPDAPADVGAALPDADGDGILNDDRDLAAWRGRPWRFSRDLRLPQQRDRLLRVVALDAAAGGAPVAVLAGWGAVPATQPAAEPMLGADFPGEVRRRLEAALPGGVALWLGSAADEGVIADESVFVPEVDADGRPVDAMGAPVDDVGQAAPALQRTRALGAYLAARALDALDDVAPEPATLGVVGRFAWVPLTNPRFGIAARLGILRPLGDWLAGRATTQAWSSGTATPACGGLGCLRYRLDRVDLGPITLLTTPGALDDGYVRGRPQSSLPLGDARNLADLDADGVPDAEDAEIKVDAKSLGREMPIVLPAPMNPQRFEAIEGLARPRVWVVGRTNGGVGGQRPRAEDVNVFEGQLDALAEFAALEANGDLDLCRAGWPCDGGFALDQLVAASRDAQPARLADIRGAHELWLMGEAAPAPATTGPWRVEAPDGTVRAMGDSLELGPGQSAFDLETDFADVGVAAGDRLWVTVGEAEEATYTVGGIVPVVLAEHPNRGDAWTASASGGGDLVYNTACELLHAGACPSRRPVPQGEDPNQVLQRTP